MKSRRKNVDEYGSQCSSDSSWLPNLLETFTGQATSVFKFGCVLVMCQTNQRVATSITKKRQQEPRVPTVHIDFMKLIEARNAKTPLK